jgi:hypothetical protein
MDFEIEKIEFEYSTSQFLRDRGLIDAVGMVDPGAQEIQRASLNWRLIAREKVSIIDNMQSIQNQAALQRIRAIKFFKSKKK